MEASMTDEEGVRRGIVEAAVEHYSLLSETQDVNAKVAAASGNALSCVKRLNDSLGKLQALSQAMARVGQQWRREKQVVLGTVAQHQKLLAFLEAPAVLDDCIRNEMYHEALMVLEHITRSAQPMKKVELFRRVEVEVRCNLERALTEVVFPRLAQQLTVASAVKVTTFLRRLGVEESQIRRLFLWKRAECMDGLLCEAEESGVPYSRIFRYLAAFKVHVGEAILQYTACFSPTIASGACSELVAWCHERAYVFLDGFRASLEKITNGSELASVIEECNSCSATATLLHMDVSGLINESLISRVKTLFAEQIALSTQSYTASMLTFSWRPSTGLQWSPSPKRAEPTSSSSASMSPPLSLVQWLPLAYALNGLLTAFNAIRKCVVPGVELFCVAKVEGLLQTVAKDLARDKELLMAMEEGGEKQVYLLFVGAFVNDFYPHVLVCMRELLGDEAERLLANSMRGSIEGLRSILPMGGCTTPCATSSPQRQQQRQEEEVTDAASLPARPKSDGVAPDVVGT
ncbi:putative oligomeric golgi complex component 8 [Trypanosoma conorhini]|uniref:Conserved oligomeric Golgi complex subunit 8 n=1 Tax=Trypanosoma conorhini TaxID=83891 RepID=A0A422Q0H3_9TRYP|nr:putative oligomeric golgi complex component 8 [Trypanosoma conorhini]RNF23494.1 putative oligomeric golgi complex component 8 [Trypanosoma conorhini]